jgi:hypothetical protein
MPPGMAHQQGTTLTGPSTWPAINPAACFMANTDDISSAGRKTMPKSSSTSNHGRRKTRRGMPRTGRRQPAPTYQGFDGRTSPITQDGSILLVFLMQLTNNTRISQSSQTTQTRKNTAQFAGTGYLDAADTEGRAFSVMAT